MLSNYPSGFLALSTATGHHVPQQAGFGAKTRRKNGCGNTSTTFYGK